MLQILHWVLLMNVLAAIISYNNKLLKPKTFKVIGLLCRYILKLWVPSHVWGGAKIIKLSFSSKCEFAIISLNTFASVLLNIWNSKYAIFRPYESKKKRIVFSDLWQNAIDSVRDFYFVAIEFQFLLSNSTHIEMPVWIEDYLVLSFINSFKDGVDTAPRVFSLREVNYRRSFLVWRILKSK